jgi:hypothetical protein
MWKTVAEAAIIQDFTRKLRFALLPVAQFGTISNAYLIGILKVVQKIPGLRISVSGIAL